MQGWRTGMEDSHLVCLDLARSKGEEGTPRTGAGSKPPIAAFAVFDGHVRCCCSRGGACVRSVSVGAMLCGGAAPGGGGEEGGGNIMCCARCTYYTDTNDCYRIEWIVCICKYVVFGVEYNRYIPLMRLILQIKPFLLRLPELLPLLLLLYYFCSDDAQCALACFKVVAAGFIFLELSELFLFVISTECRWTAAVLFYHRPIILPVQQSYHILSYTSIYNMSSTLSLDMTCPKYQNR